jgi:hypothetical protein
MEKETDEIRSDMGFDFIYVPAGKARKTRAPVSPVAVMCVILGILTIVIALRLR